MSNTITVQHLARVEGHGGVTIVLDGDGVSQVRFDVFEGARLLEALVRGRSFEDVSQILSRICAICSVAHALTSIKAAENVFGIEPSPQTELLRDLMYRGESIESHALHLFLLALPDYLNYPSAVALAADYPERVKLGLRLKKLGNSIQESIGGRAIHPVNAVIGGFGKLPEIDELIALRRELLKALEDCDTVVRLMASLRQTEFCRASTAFAALHLPGDYGYYAGDEIVVLENGSRQMIPAAQYRSLTNEKTVPHSHAKHSSFNGKPFMVGALARLSLSSDKLSSRAAEAMRDMNLVLPSDNPMDNNKAQAVELIFDIERALENVERVLSDGLKEEPRPTFRPRAGAGTAVTEAPRGLLIHSYEYDDKGKIVRGDVVTPTALNAASIEEYLRLAVEQSAEKEGPALVRKLEMVVRAYDPCISCSVHVVQRRDAI